MLGLIDPLAANFPVVATLVGADYFAELAKAYSRAFPPNRPELSSFGAELPGFIATRPGIDAVPYLADMARLELALTFAEHAAEAEPLAAAALQKFSPESLEALHLTPHPSLRFVVSDFPLLAIWQAHQPDGSLDTPIAFDQGGDQLVVVRPRQQALIRKLSPGEFALVMTLAADQPLAAACHSALASQRDFSVIDGLAGLLAAELFCEARLP
jgi:hypothetical protein